MHVHVCMAMYTKYTVKLGLMGYLHHVHVAIYSALQLK